MDLKFCKDCKHAEPQKVEGGPSSNPTLACQHERCREYNLVNGAYIPLRCTEARSTNRLLHGHPVPCGVAGKLFEAREVNQS